MRDVPKHELNEKDVTERILGCAITVHRGLGPGLLESVYEECLCHELAKSGLPILRQHAIPVVYDGVTMECGFRADIIVASRVLVEIKSVERFAPIHEAQLLTYLRLTKLKVGLLLNFNSVRMIDGMKRMVL
jgi:GxxExxY protein